MKKYNIIYADPPWSYRVWSEDKKQAQGCAKRYYQTMSIEYICKMPVGDLCELNTKLFIWATMPCLPEALRVISAWGFEYKTVVFAWIKTNKRQDQKQINFLPIDFIDRFYGIGHWTASNIELCLGALCPNGALNRQDKSISQIVLAPITKHSEKPKEVRQKIVRLCGDLPRIELFARQKTEGWDALGFDIDGKDIKESIKLLAQKKPL